MASAGTLPAMSNWINPRRGESIPFVPANIPGPAPLLLLTLFSKMLASLLAPIVIVAARAAAHRIVAIVRPAANSGSTLTMLVSFAAILQKSCFRRTAALSHKVTCQKALGSIVEQPVILQHPPFSATIKQWRLSRRRVKNRPQPA